MNVANDIFLKKMHPAEAVGLPVSEVLKILQNRLGDELATALQPTHSVPSPVSYEENGAWLRRSNMVGINVRTIQNFWNVIPYSLTLPTVQDSIHLLPIWECGVVASLYGMSSWNLNPEFFSLDLAAEIPLLDTVEKQLKVVVNLLHALGKTVGMDVIPHTDRYSEIVLANPSHFEWLQRRDFEILNHDNHLSKVVQQQLMRFLVMNGTGNGDRNYPRSMNDFFSINYDESDRCKILFGEKNNPTRRAARRDKIIQLLYDLGLEPVPATMAPPYRDLMVSRLESAKTVDKAGRVWRDYALKKPQPMSRVFGPLTRYKLYENEDYNWRWQINFEAPKGDVWYYVCKHYADVQHEFGFDFMRGDMSHVQMREEGVPAEAGVYYDLQRAVKLFIQQSVPYFGFFAETFLAPPNEMAYGDESEHLERLEADSTLGNLQSFAINETEFYLEFKRYFKLLKSNTFAPNFTVITADKDDPRFDAFYLNGNELRLFMALFLTDMPSYTALGFECRDAHPTPAPNEHYTKLYVFRIEEGAKATHGNYVWGSNKILFGNICRIRRLAEEILPKIRTDETDWLLLPEVDLPCVIVWTQKNRPRYIFAANLDTEIESKNIQLELNVTNLLPIFSTKNPSFQKEKLIEGKKNIFSLGVLAAGEARAYRIA